MDPTGTAYIFPRKQLLFCCHKMPFDCQNDSQFGTIHLMSALSFSGFFLRIISYVFVHFIAIKKYEIILIRGGIR
jgi:hypothetical protein